MSDKIFSWDAGPGAGAAGDLERAFESAAPYVLEGHRADVTEKRVSLHSAGNGGSVSEHLPTGRAWRGCLAGGELMWSEVAGQAGEALAGEVA